MKRKDFVEQQTRSVLALVMQYRREQPRLGTLKVYKIIKDRLEKMNIKLGRDKFFDMMRENRMLIQRKRRFHKTTNSNHRFRKHPNLIKGKVFNKSEQVWVSDLTYIKSQNGHLFLALTTDLYSKKIMGYHLADNTKTESTTAALRMALKNRKFKNRKLIHHSDRAFQYCSHEYTKLLSDNKIKISMTEKYDPYENAVAERVNGILKDEFEIDEGFVSEKQAQKEIKNAIEVYNSKRPHISCDYSTPDFAHIHQRHKPKSYSWLSTYKHLLTKEKRSKKEKVTPNNATFN